MAGGNDVLRDSVADTVGRRLTVHKDQKSGITEVPYSSGHSLTWERTEVGDGKTLKEVRTLTKIAYPKATFTSPWESQDHYDRVMKKGKYAQEKTT